MDINTTMIDIVVAQYNENLTWLTRLEGVVAPFAKHNIVVYSKGSTTKEPDTNYKNTNLIPMKTIRLPNVGRETHSYLTHIIERYDTLADCTMFVQGYIGDHIGVDVDPIVWMKERIAEACASESSWVSGGSGLSQDAENHAEGAYSSQYTFNVHHHKGNVLNEKGEVFGDWLQGLGTIEPFYQRNHHPHIIWYKGACFAATREAIRRVPLKVWQAIHASVSHDVNPIGCYFMERAWYHLMAGGC